MKFSLNSKAYAVRVPIITCLFSLSLLGFSTVSAVEANDPANQRPVRDVLREGNQKLDQIRDDARAKAEDIRKNAQQERASILKNATGTSPEIRAALQANNAKRVEAIKENLEMRKKSVEARRLELKSELEKLRADRKDAIVKKLDTNAKKRVAKKIEDIYKKLEGMITRLTKADSEIVARITKISDAGGDISSITPLIDVAQAALSKAKTDVEATKTALTAETNTETSKEAIRALVKAAEGSIRSAAEAYKKVMVAMKSIPKPVEDDQTPASTSPQNI